LRKSLRFSVKKLLNEIERQHAGIKYSLVRGYERLVELLPKPAFELQRCEICGEPSASKICKACEMLLRLQKLTHKKTKQNYKEMP